MIVGTFWWVMQGGIGSTWLHQASFHYISAWRCTIPNYLCLLHSTLAPAMMEVEHGHKQNDAFCLLNNNLILTLSRLKPSTMQIKGNCTEPLLWPSMQIIAYPQTATNI